MLIPLLHCAPPLGRILANSKFASFFCFLCLTLCFLPQAMHIETSVNVCSLAPASGFIQYVKCTPARPYTSFNILNCYPIRNLFLWTLAIVLMGILGDRRVSRQTHRMQQISVCLPILAQMEYMAQAWLVSWVGPGVLGQPSLVQFRGQGAAPEKIVLADTRNSSCGNVGRTLSA